MASLATPNGDGGHGDMRRGGLGVDPLLDLKGITKLQDFSGREEDWPEWHFRIKATMPLLGMYELIAKVEAMTEQPDQTQLTEIEIKQSHLLWSLLCQIVKGRAYTLLRLCPDGHGALAWWRIFQQYQTPSQITRHMAVLMGIMRPS